MEESKRVIIPTHRGKSEVFMLIGKSGDFLICDSNHRLVYKEKGKYYAEPVVSLKHKSYLSPLRLKSSIGFLDLFKWSASKCAAELLLFIKMNKSYERDHGKKDKEISTKLCKLALTRYQFEIDNYLIAGSFRTFASIFGYNLVAVEKRDKIVYQVKFTRVESTYIHRVVLTGLMEEIGTCTVMNKEPFYSNQGFYQRNTGGDMIRRDLIMFYELYHNDPEYRANCIICSTVHDEINWYCKRTYIKKLYDHIQRIMNFDDHGKFPIPIEVSVGVSPTDWGSCLDIDGVTDDNKLIVKECEGVEPYDAT